VHDDILDYTQNSEQLGKPAYNDIKEGIVTSPLVYALVELQQKDAQAAKLFEQSLKRKCEGEEDV
jgi:heptaprenyl diphosphate synthase